MDTVINEIFRLFDWMLVTIVAPANESAIDLLSSLTFDG